METLANAAPIILNGAEWYRQFGTEKSAGTKVFALAGDIINAGIIEVPMGIRLGDIIYKIGGGITGGRKFKAIQSGGPSGGCLTGEHLNTAVDYESLAKLGAIMGSGGLVVMSENTCMVDTARYFMDFIRDESCGKCLPCRNGTKRMLEILERITEGKGEEGDLELLEELAETIRQTAMCGLGQTAPNPVLSTLRYFRNEYEEHIYEKHCRAGVCSELQTSPCRNACPANVFVPGYISLLSAGRFEDAYRLIRQDNPFPSVCGRICNRRCEDACTRGTVDQAVAIDEVKRFIAQQDLDAATRFVPEKVIPKVDGEFGDKIAVIGAGPAGMSCAFYLAEKGYRPTVFEKETRPGGMLMNGIPSFRLEKDVVEAEIDVLREMGVEFRCGVEVGKDVTIAQLREEGYQGFYVAVGLQSGGKLNIPGGEAQGVQAGIDFMRHVNSGLCSKMSGRVVVIGGGNIGADVARTALRCGAASVDLYCLEGYEDMPMGEEDRGECEREGITIHAGWGQTEIVERDGKCAGIRFRKCLSVKNAEGRFDPKFDDAVTEETACDVVLYCIGQKVEWKELLTGTKVEFNPNGTVKADPVTYQTAEPDIFVGGDAYTGQKFAIDAIAAGKQGAVSLHRWVQHATLTIGRDRRQFIELDKENALIAIDSYDNTPRQQIGYNEALRKTFRDERVSFTEEQVKKETARCLGCGASIVDPNKCIGCGICTTKCAFDAIHLHRERPECSTMYKCEDKMKAILPYMIKRNFKIKRAARKSK